NPEGLEGLQRTQEVRDGSRESVEPPHDHRVKAPAVRFPEQAIELRPLLLCPGDADVNVLPCDGPAAALAVLPKLARLHRRVLPVVRGADSRVNCSLHSILQDDGPGVQTQSRPIHVPPATTLPVPATPPRNRCEGCRHSPARGASCPT